MRGFWGDIVNSPYPTLALEVDSYPENEKLLEKRNEMYVHVRLSFSEQNRLPSMLPSSTSMI